MGPLQWSFMFFMWIFSVNVLGSFLDTCDNLTKHFLSSNFVVRIQYIVHIMYKVCVHQLFVTGKVSHQQ